MQGRSRIQRVGLSAEKGGENVVDSYGFSTNGYDQIIVFKDPSIFAEILAANPHMTAIMGADDHTREEFPGVYIAAIRAEAN